MGRPQKYGGKIWKYWKNLWLGNKSGSAIFSGCDPQFFPDPLHPVQNAIKAEFMAVRMQHY